MCGNGQRIGMGVPIIRRALIAIRGAPQEGTTECFAAARGPIDRSTSVLRTGTGVRLRTGMTSADFVVPKTPRNPVDFCSVTLWTVSFVFISLAPRVRGAGEILEMGNVLIFYQGTRNDDRKTHV